MSTGRLIVYAPSVHTGGGLVLLQALASSTERPAAVLFVDARARSRLEGMPRTDIVAVAPTVPGRLGAQRALRAMARETDTVLCFQGLPPLLPVAGRVVVFHQNRLALNGESLRGYGAKARIQISASRWLGPLLRKRASAWLVQTPSMRRALLAWLGDTADVRVLPFVPETGGAGAAEPRPAPTWDFVYVSDGVPHKNHPALLEAWRELAANGLRPSLALTLPPRDSALETVIADSARREGLRITNLGHLDHAGVLALYRDARALVYPSLLESYGLPLVEADRCGLPIVAAELDYVRDVCVPAETFDPRSPMSIARAVRRFLGRPETPRPPASPSEFLREVLG